MAPPLVIRIKVQYTKFLTFGYQTLDTILKYLEKNMRHIPQKLPFAMSLIILSEQNIQKY